MTCDSLVGRAVTAMGSPSSAPVAVVLEVRSSRSQLAVLALSLWSAGGNG
jgi:hypothetical protein